jgi:hypothetical protein
MKITISKDNIFSLMNSENYKKNLDYDISEITKKYADIIIEYITFINENIKVKNKRFIKFIIIRGLDTITHVFNYILYFTKNLEITYYHCQKSFYFYIEFVSQITEEEKIFLELTTRDATTYVYKKTIFDVNRELKKNNEINNKEFRENIDIVCNYIKLFQTYLLKIIKIENIEIDKIHYIAKLTDNIILLKNKSAISLLENITEELYYKIENIDRFFEINQLIVEHFLKNTEVLEKAKYKMFLHIFDEKILESNEEFIDWFLFQNE